VKRSHTVRAALALCGALLIPALGIAGAPAAPPPPPGLSEVSCTRGGLQRAANYYLEAQAKGDPNVMPLARQVGYWENIAPADIKKGFLHKPLKINRHMSIFDEATCQSFTEIIVTDKAEPYVAGVRLRVSHDRIAEVEVLWTSTGYWLFDADAYLKYASMEQWDPIPADRRDSRGTIVAAANAYLDAFLEGKIDRVPWGFPCVRIEGGMYTGKGQPDDSCEVGVPGGVNIANRRFVVDEVLGSVVVYCTVGVGGPNGGSGAPDTHLFRIENGKLRYVHTLTHLLQSAFRGNAGSSAN
jgi:hypothetical protein